MAAGEPDPNSVSRHFHRRVQLLSAAWTQPNVSRSALMTALCISEVHIEAEGSAFTGVNTRGTEAVSAMMLHDYRTSVVHIFLSKPNLV